jgi:ATP-dependent Clp protease ATP-binding subunit ClpC
LIYIAGMFERYTEPARRVLFFARFETSTVGGVAIESEHLLLGLLRSPGAIDRRIFADAKISSEQVRQEVERQTTTRERIATSVEIPFSADAKRILQYTADEADSLGHSHIGPEHLLLAILRVPESIAGAILAGHGLRLDTARQAVASATTEIADEARRAPAAPAAAPDGMLSVSASSADVDRQDNEAHIMRIQQLVGRLHALVPASTEASELLHVIYIELESLKNRLL